MMSTLVTSHPFGGLYGVFRTHFSAGATFQAATPINMIDITFRDNANRALLGAHAASSAGVRDSIPGWIERFAAESEALSMWRMGR